MNPPHRRILLALPLLMLWPTAAAESQPAASPEAPSPQATVAEFYRWYLHVLKANRNPLSDEKPTLRKYVSAPLIARLEKQAASPDGMDADYFLQAQDFSDDWVSNIAVTDARVDRGSATMVVTLGAPGSERQRLNVSLIATDGAWRIRSVRQLPP
jgi:hypothetical protein